MTQRTNEVSTNEKMERAPVCGMSVDPSKAAAKAEHGGKTYYFCAPGCAKRFQQAPEKYLQPAKKLAAQSGVANLHEERQSAAAPASEEEADKPVSLVAPAAAAAQQEPVSDRSATDKEVR